MHGLAGSLTVHFPWGSLLRGVLGHDDAVLAGIEKLLAPGAEATALVSVVPSDNAPAVPPAGALARAYGRTSLALLEARAATPSEIEASHSSGAKRLRSGSERPVTLLRARAIATPAPTGEGQPFAAAGSAAAGCLPPGGQRGEAGGLLQ